MTNEVTNGAEETATTDGSVTEHRGSSESLPETKSSEAAPVAAASPEHEPEVESKPAQIIEPPVDNSTQPAEPAIIDTVAEIAPNDDQQAAAEVDFGAILEQFELEQTVFHAGELVTGTVVGISDRGVLIDFGYKSEGFVPTEEFTGPDGEIGVTIGESVEVVIRSIHSGDSAPQLSRLDALGQKVWGELEAAYRDEMPVTGRVVDKTKGGLRIDINGLEAFLPGSQIDSRPIHSLDSYVGQDIEARIIKFSRRRNNIVLSRKILTDEVVNAQKAETLSTIDLGYIVEGTIKNLTEYGAFVDIGGIDGLLHVTDMSWGRLRHPGDLFKSNDHVQVKVLKLDREKEKISLGYKQLLPDPWSTVVEMYPVNTKVHGTVSSVTDYGVFVELEPGVEGLVHVSEISWSRRPQSPKRLFHKGQDVEVQVLGVDTDERRISLGMKQFQENPWDNVDEKYPIGSKIHGRVRNLTDFGAFVEIEDGIDGLVHISDITWAKKIRHPKDVLKKDQEVDAIVTSIDKRGQRLSLSMKDLTPSAWEGFVATHRPGDVVRGKVSRFTNFGVFVEIGEGLEGLCHISELSDERVDRVEDVADLGQEMDFKILRIEPVEQKVGLSHRAVGKDDEPVADTKIYSTEAKGGMASLGELANLKFGDAVSETPPPEDEKKKAKKSSKKTKTDETAADDVEANAPVVAEKDAGSDATDAPVPKSETTPDTLAEETAEPVAETAPELVGGEAESVGEPSEKETEIKEPSDDVSNDPTETAQAEEPSTAEAEPDEAPPVEDQIELTAESKEKEKEPKEEESEKKTA